MSFSYTKFPRRPLVALFRDIPIGAFDVPNSAFGAYTHDAPLQDLIVKCTLPFWNWRSEDEVRAAVRFLEEKMTLRDGGKRSVFHLLHQAADEFLLLQGNQFRVKREHYLRWRDLALRLDGDTFTVAWMAFRDLNRGWGGERIDFNWPTVLLPEDVRFDALLNRGITENHAHLGAVGPVFLPAWISLMTQIMGRSVAFEKAGLHRRFLSDEIHPDETYARFPLQVEILEASWLRLKLFLMLKRVRSSISYDLPIGDSFSFLENPLSQILTTQTNQILATQTLQGMIESISFRNGSQHNHPDYTIEDQIVLNDRQSGIAFVGERWLMYQMFYGIFNEEPEFLDLANDFYKYLIIKNKFRKELIQLNDKVGFHNFYLYQDRKDIFCKDNRFLNHSRYFSTLAESQASFGITHFDLRFKPENNYWGLNQKLGDISRTFEPFPTDLLGDWVSLIDPHNSQQDNSLEANNLPNRKLVAHFIKGREDERHSLPFTNARHHRLRREVKLQTIAILNLRQRRHPNAKLICAVDAANSELGCRPEVFAQAFRTLRDHELKPETISSYSLRRLLSTEVDEIPKLRMKFHAGEEFLDIVDGLRYIDEAIHFLDLQRGEHLGHALAAGINVRDWYHRKSNTLFLPKQQVLDNYVWLLGTTTRHSVPVEASIRAEWEQRVNRLAAEVYEEAIAINRHNIHWEDLCESWKLRGDDPLLYQKGRFEEDFAQTIWRRCGKNSSKLGRTSLRDNSRIANLYYYYHFSLSVRQQGLREVAVRYSPKEISVIEHLQDAVRNEIAEIGLFVETLPTVNVSISAIRRYDEHPIFSFFPVKSSELPSHLLPLHVSVNSDNPGVCETNAAAELALLLVSLQKQLNADGTRKYNDDEIYGWLERIRLNGIEQQVP